MPRTLLQLVQQACGEIGIPQPQFLFGSQNDLEMQLIALAIREGKEFYSAANKNGGWQELRKDYTFNLQPLTGLTGNTVANSNVITGISSTAGLVGGNVWGISANGLGYYTTIVTVDSPTQITVSNPVNLTQTGVALNIGKIAYDLPSDLEYFVQKTFWDNKYKWSLLGPINAQEQQILKYGVVASGPRNKFYIQQNKMYFNPMPQGTDLIAFQYFSKNWCQSATGVTREYWQEDTDIYLLDEEAFIEGLKWRFLRAKGLDYAEEQNVYEMLKQRLIARDGGSRDLPLGGPGYEVQFLSGENLPWTGYGNM